MLKLVKFILALLFLILGAAFAVLNDKAVELDLYFVLASLPLSLVLLLAMGAGIVLGAFVSAFYFMRLRKENADLRRQSRLARQEAKNLRKIPAGGH